MVELVKLIVAPLLGMPLAVKLALNQMKSSGAIGVPLKLEVLDDEAAQGRRRTCWAAIQGRIAER